jgi:hypothetical protein
LTRVNSLENVPHQVGKRYTWEGSDECDSASGSGWLKLKDKNTIEGNIKFHQGDSSTFLARRA